MSAAPHSTPRPPIVGDVAPDFDLVAHPGPRFRLSEAVGRGPVMVAFIPGAFTRVCTRELCAFSRDWDEYARLGAQFVGVSVDSRPVLRAYAEQEGITVPLASDFERTTVRAYAVEWRSPWGPTAKRCVFVVDRRRIVRYAYVAEDPEPEPPYGEIKAALRSLG